MKKHLLFSFFVSFAVCVQAQCWRSVDAGNFHNLGIKTNGTLWAWGDNGSGAFGNGTTISSFVPIQIGTVSNWQSISAGLAHSAGIQTNGSLWVWGDNMYGQLGNGTLATSLSPINVASVVNWQAVSVGYYRTLAIKTDGTLWGWGRNDVGQIGDGTITDKNVPIQIGTDTDWQSVSTGSEHTFAIKSNGTLWGWGNNFGGMLVMSGPAIITSPTQIGTANDWKQVETHFYRRASALKTNGTMWGWGTNNQGQLGIGTNVSVNGFTQAGTDTDWQTIAVGDYHALGIKTTGSLWAWGGNNFGQLGIGVTTSTTSPRQTGNLLVWQSISSEAEHSLAIKTDGTLWAWGENYGGQLGDGTLTDRYVPIEILSGNVIANATSASLCSGSSLTLSGAGATTYTWSNSVTNGASFVPTASNVYTVTGTDAIGCYNTATIAITVAPNTTVTANASSATICAGGTVALTGGGATNYSWSGGVSNASPFAPTSTASYSVSDATGCSNTASITVNVVPSPAVSVTSTSICAGASATVSASANPAAGTTYSWSAGNGGSSLTVSPSITTSYTVTATNTNCSSSAVATVSVTPVIAPITGFSYPSPICLTSSNPLPVTISGFTSGGNYVSGTGLSTDPISGLIDLANSSAGTYIITYSVAANGCNASGSSTFTVTLNAPAVPVTGFSYALPICAKDSNPSPLLVSNFTTGGSFSGTGAAVNSTNGTIDLLNTPAGTYAVTYSVNAANCVQAGTNTATVTISPNPVLSINSSTTIITGEQTVLTASTSANTYTWFPATNLSCTDCPTPTASPNKTATYCLRTSDGVCTNSTCVTVSVESLCEGDKGLYFPNAFSPNGDGNNDVFCVQGTNRCVADFSMLIYNRWGEKVFESVDISFCWDGTYKGKVLPPDVYVYYAKAKDQYKQDIIKKGNVSLIK